MKFPRTLLKGQSLDFSFSGLKTAVLYHVNGVPGQVRVDDAAPAKPPEAAGPSGQAASSPAARLPRRRRSATGKGPGYGKGADRLIDQEKADIAASFQHAVADVLALKLQRAGRQIRARSLLLGGGVAANTAIRAAAAEVAAKLGCTLRLPPLKYCTDNAAMIAGLAYHQLQAGQIAGLDLEATATVRR